jgi:malate synthase
MSHVTVAEAGANRPDGVEILGRDGAGFEKVLSHDALAFIAGLHRRFEARRRQVLGMRAERQIRFDAGELPDFLAETREIRQSEWAVGAIPHDLQDRRVEITGPCDRKMVINALNSGASVFMADLEDATSPVWENQVSGQVNLMDLWAGRIDFTDPKNGKSYAVGPEPAVLLVRPRGLHLPESHMRVDGEEVSGALFDFGLYLFHNAGAAIAAGSGPYYYLPKLESHHEARLWNDVFVAAQAELGLPNGTIKATILIETLPSAFEMDEILYEMRDHIIGLNCGRWDYIFSYIKCLRNNPDYVLPDRAQVVMGEAFLGAYSTLLIRTCHKRGAFAMGGMAAQIPNRRDPEANRAALAKVRADKEREVHEGHDGTWVAHPDLVPVAKSVFDEHMPQANQLDRVDDGAEVTQADMLQIHAGQRTEAGLRQNIRVGVQYIEAWLSGRGAVPLYNLMEDAATAEICRAQIWQWLRFGAELEDGRQVSKELFAALLEDEMAAVREMLGADVYDVGQFGEAVALFSEMSTSEDFEEFLTLPAYRMIV